MCPGAVTRSVFLLEPEVSLSVLSKTFRGLHVGKVAHTPTAQHRNMRGEKNEWQANRPFSTETLRRKATSM
jgi:hypothetical protein